MFDLKPRRRINLTEIDVQNIIKSEGYSCTCIKGNGVLSEPLPKSLIEEFVEDGLFVSTVLGINKTRVSFVNTDAPDYRK